MTFASFLAEIQFSPRNISWRQKFFQFFKAKGRGKCVGVRQDITRLTKVYKISHFSICVLSTLLNFHSEITLGKRWSFHKRGKIPTQHWKNEIDDSFKGEFLSSRSSERNKINIEVDYWTDKAKVGKYSVEKSTKTTFSLMGDEMAGILNDCIEGYSIHKWPVSSRNWIISSLSIDFSASFTISLHGVQNF